MIKAIKIENKQHEKLDVLIEGNSEAVVSIIFVHGLGTNKDEGTNLFVDISKALKDKYRIIRFDFSGYGKSEGRQEDASCDKQASDLKAILDYVKLTYNGKLCLIAHSLGTSVVSVLSPEGIEKTIFTGIPNPNMKAKLDSLKSKILSRPSGVVNEEGISLHIRSTGELQRIGPDFWRCLRRFDPMTAIKNFSLKTDLILFRALQDNSEKGTERYSKIKSLKYVELDGDHTFTRHKDREELIRRIVDFLK